MVFDFLTYIAVDYFFSSSLALGGFPFDMVVVGLTLKVLDLTIFYDAVFWLISFIVLEVADGSPIVVSICYFEVDD